MTSSIAAFAHQAGLASRERAGFEANQVIETGGLKIEAFVRRRGHRVTHVEYASYQSPWADLQEALSGQVELVGEELCGLTIDCEGPSTWVVDRSANVVIRKTGCHLFEPIPGLATLGELSFLDSLTQDFLLRDLGEESINEKTIRRLSMKPKTSYRSQLLSAVVFPIHKATIDFDIETYFPVKIVFVPSAESPAASILGPNAKIQITYQDIRIPDKPSASASFEPPADAKLFAESTITAAEFDEQLPYPVDSALLIKHGFDPQNGMAIVSLDADNERSYSTVQYAASDSPDAKPDSDILSDEANGSPVGEAAPTGDAPSARLTITVGNYVSKNMARRRATFSDSGQPPSDPTDAIQLLDRKEQWEQRYPGIDTSYAPVESFFEEDGVFWFLTGTGMDIQSMAALAKDLLESQSAAEREIE